VVALAGRGVEPAASAAGAPASTAAPGGGVPAVAPARADLAVAARELGCEVLGTCAVGVTVTNNGPAVAHDVAVVLTLGSALPDDRLNTDRRCAAQRCTLGTLQPGASSSFDYVVDIVDNPAAVTATAKAVEHDPNSANNSRTVRVPSSRSTMDTRPPPPPPPTPSTTTTVVPG
jgi:hypothetical protein